MTRRFIRAIVSAIKAAWVVIVGEIEICTSRQVVRSVVRTSFWDFKA